MEKCREIDQRRKIHSKAKILTENLPNDLRG